MLPYLVTIAVLILSPAEQEGDQPPPAWVWRIGRNEYSPYNKERRGQAAAFSSVHFSAWWFRAAVRILRISMARVMGPTPPGTGVM